MRLAAGINPTTINCHLYGFKRFLYYLDESDKPVCQRTLLIKPLTAGGRVPKDIPIEQLKSLLAEIEDQAIHKHASNRRMAILDRAWVHLMLYSGLRTCEVRQMRLKDINWESQRIRIEASKGFNDRMVFMNMITVDTLKKWMEIRGDAEYLTDHVFLYRHKPLSRRYCQVRLSTYGKRTGNHISPHKLRHSCATLLLNAGAPIVTVQTLLGHKKIDTTLGYARLYDGTVAADYYRAMGQVEKLFDVCPVDQDLAPNPAELLVLVDSLSTGTLNESQRNTLALLRARIQSLETDLDYTFALENQFVPIGIHEESE